MSILRRNTERMKFRTIKGVQDITPPDTALWQKVEAIARRIFRSYGYAEIRTPIIEFTELFTRGIGETTDIVEKEMYTFPDRAGRSLTLRPEGTASVVRAYIQNALHTLPAPQKFYYLGPMFRYERPQKGRYRQFHQIGVEAFGTDDPMMDAELLDMLRSLLEALGMGGLSFEVNSIGCPQCRPGYREALTGYLSGRRDHLCNDCLRRYEKNPLRVLDCKAPSCQSLKQEAPRIIDHLCDDCKEHFERLRGYLKTAGINFTVNPLMVRGLDYYTRTTFEVTSSDLGAQNAVAAGGRYDGLVREFGGPDTPAVGFALGMERLVTLLSEREGFHPPGLDVFFAILGNAPRERAFRLVKRLRSSGLSVEMDFLGSSLKSQMRRADKSGARYALILGEDELERGVVKYKRLSDGSQGEVREEELPVFFLGLRE